MKKPKIALTGGIATGKTTVANRFRELGAVILDADIYARRVVEPGTASWKALRELLGPGYFHPDGSLKRRELRDHIIADPSLREQLDGVLHPFILRAMWEDWEEQRATHPDAVVVFDIPLLFEGNFNHDFDIVILAYAKPEIQVGRLMLRDGLSREDALKTLSIQFPIESKKALAHYVIDNSGSLEATLLQTDTIWKEISAPR